MSGKRAKRLRREAYRRRENAWSDGATRESAYSRTVIYPEGSFRRIYRALKKR